MPVMYTFLLVASHNMSPYSHFNIACLPTNLLTPNLSKLTLAFAQAMALSIHSIDQIFYAKIFHPLCYSQINSMLFVAFVLRRLSGIGRTLWYLAVHALTPGYKWSRHNGRLAWALFKACLQLPWPQIAHRLHSHYMLTKSSCSLCTMYTNFACCRCMTSPDFVCRSGRFIKQKTPVLILALTIDLHDQLVHCFQTFIQYYQTTKYSITDALSYEVFFHILSPGWSPLERRFNKSNENQQLHVRSAVSVLQEFPPFSHLAHVPDYDHSKSRNMKM